MMTGETIVPFGKGRDKMRFQQISEVRAYWEALRQGQDVPMRAQVDPRGMERALEHAFILERVAPQVARFRLAGMHPSDLAGMEVRGMPFSILFSAEARPQIAEALEQVFTGPAIAEVSLAATAGFGHAALEARVILLPLRSDLGDISRVLGCLVTEGALGRAPRRFDIAAQSVTGLSVPRPVWQPARAAVRGLAEAARPFEGPKGERSHLRLVKTDQ